MKAIHILSLVVIFFIIFILYNINKFSNVDNKYDCFLSSKVCVDRITYNNNYYYDLYLNNSEKTGILFGNENLFFIDFKEDSGKLYIIVQESIINNRKIIEECKKINQPFNFPENEYVLNLYILSSSENKISIKLVNKEDTPQLIKEWFSHYRINPKLEFIC
ncbi:hypothetical protein RMB13_13555 [Acinetobacter sp. V102_4]|uniref:hypothetical protein n=1 Tax=Acinetobacter sp. V102_4 TaxID=3072984 RepID=UPI00287DBDD2|nr:hypothetical protein [Acinetobacter sp. V102_4]MDS7930477.1 hypothetical protein [Acinetobacter sp. V102_4]